MLKLPSIFHAVENARAHAKRSFSPHSKALRAGILQGSCGG